ncbi:serine/threonine protein kinase [[Phormidium ambiguum] IAM M-71]|uniref:non-specific serine/threonine protein kinase n=1 Tax=[Phormidium ambiguum] IAM M-71 TaxID=454136 RepID=A0A1U7IU05_9CYAN|nr:serine/threonine-protein kinase [Phormidium ambiguum]OKH40964.1 serine/threonine protein kinase [Phormidium ambiguum IAM M-71]
MADPKDPNIGRLLDSRYQLMELIGTGAMGRVYRANDTLLGGVPVAVKFLSLGIQNQKLRLRERFEQEARTCALLGQKSLHIVRVTDFGVDENSTPFYVMEYLQGESLSDVIRSQALPLPKFLSLARQICLGLQCAHQGIPVEGEICSIIHRDIKPSNILVIQDPSLGQLVKILDFGIAKLRQADSDQTNYYLGTLAYSSPEQMEGKELDTRSDIYSLGVLMFEMLTGKMPLQAETHSFGGWYKVHHFQKPRSFDSANPDLKLPKALENLIMSCLAKAPSDRPQSVAEILRALEPLEQRFSTGRQIGQRISTKLSEISQGQQAKLLNAPSTSPEEIERLARMQTWPPDKPHAEIVFANTLGNGKQKLATLWVMLKKSDIQQRMVCKRYNQFLFSMSPHPMLLWITALYTREVGARWLRCYLDMKTPQGEEITKLLGETGRYLVLLFPLEEPKRCIHVLSVNIAPTQCQLLQQWAQTSQALISTGSPKMSKELLHNQFERIKPQMLMKLETSSSLGQLDDKLEKQS